MKNYSFNNESDIKNLAYNLKKYLADIGFNVKHMNILNGISQSVGFKNWNVYSSKLKENNKPYQYKNPFKNINELFEKGSISQIVEFIIYTSFRDEGDNDIWKGRAISLCYAVIKPLVWMRNHNGFIISGQSIYNAMDLKNMIDLSYNLDIDKSSILGLQSYLVSLPGYKSENDRLIEQNETVNEQHGYIRMQFKTLITLQGE